MEIVRKALFSVWQLPVLVFQGITFQFMGKGQTQGY